jgi:hypothetical protein
MVSTALRHFSLAVLVGVVMAFRSIPIRSDQHVLKNHRNDLFLSVLDERTTSNPCAR